MDERNKAGFWAVAVGAFLLVCVPSTVFIDALSRYRRYVDGVDGAALRPTRVRFVPHKGAGRAESAPKLDFVEFSLRQPKAKTVSLVGDFNGWKEGTLALKKGSGGRWELLLPLAKGRHLYLYVIDGKQTLDPSAPETADDDGRKVSLKEVP
jgi:hypothetical protein